MNKFHLEHYRAMNDDYLIAEYVDQKRSLERNKNIPGTLARKDASNHFNAIMQVFKERGINIEEVLQKRKSKELISSKHKVYIKETESTGYNLMIGGMLFLIGACLAIVNWANRFGTILILLGATFMLVGLGRRYLKK